MIKRLTISLSVGILLAIYPAGVSAQGDNADVKAKSRALARKIDKWVNKGLDEAGMTPGAKADIAQLARPAHLDLTGKIPTVVQLQDLIDETNDSPTKFEDRIDVLLADRAYANNFAHYWRSVMLGGATNQQQAFFLDQFDNWLRERLAANASYDKMVREVLTTQAGGPNARQQFLQQQQGGAVSPFAFYQINENKVENLAGATARVFMGIKIECAQCHKHPFASWTRKQFWEMAAFFNNQGQIKIPLTDQVAKARYITGEEPDMKKSGSLRTTFADWMTGSTNPYFAKATVDHVWQYFFGVSLIEPILEPTADSPQAHPELLDEMAKAFVDSGFDLKFLIRSIVLSDAYQRTSVAYSENSKLDLQMFAKMPVRGMMPEQLYDSFLVASGVRQAQPAPAPQGRFAQLQNQQNNERAQFLSMFNSQDRRNEAQTSILQALFMMNGKFMRDRANHPLQTIATQNTTTERKVEAVFMMTLSRLPTSFERERMVRFVNDGGGTGEPNQAIVDLCWVLLNSSEFLLNH